LIYVIDDNPEIAEAIRDVLASEGYPVHVFLIAAHAIARIRGGERPAVIVLDLGMPDSGEDFLRALADDDLQIPILLVSATHQRELDGFRGRVADVQRKPLDVDQLLTAIARLGSRDPMPDA
jgi:CheY-like chemotaxis protein